MVWRDVFLGVIAVATLAIAVAQIGVIIAAGLMARRVGRMVDQLERDVKPLFGHLNAIGGDASRAVALATAQVERADKLFAEVAVRIEQTLNVVQASIGGPAREGRAMLGRVPRRDAGDPRAPRRPRPPGPRRRRRRALHLPIAPSLPGSVVEHPLTIHDNLEGLLEATDARRLRSAGRPPRAVARRGVGAGSPSRRRSRSNSPPRSTPASSIASPPRIPTRPTCSSPRSISQARKA